MDPNQLVGSLVLIAYIAALLAIGVVFRARGRSRSHAYLANRNLGAGLVAGSLAATVIGGSATVVLARHVHTHGLAGIWLDLPLGIALLLFGFLLAARVRATNCFSLPQIAGKLHGPGFRRAVAVLAVLSATAWFGLLIRAGAPFVATMTPLSEDAGALLLAVVFIAYTTLGGQAAVAWTDGLQLLLLFGLGLLMPTAAVLIKTDMLRGVPASLLEFPTGGAVDGLSIVGAIALVGLPGLVGGDIWSKALSARDLHAARRGSIIAGMMKVLATACVATLALGAHVLIPELKSGNDVLAQVIGAALPPQLALLCAVAFLAAMMSSADSVLLTAATVVDVDLLPQPRSAKEESLRIRSLIIALGCLGALIGYGATSVVTLMKWAYTVFAAGAPLPVILGLQSHVRFAPWSATLCLVIGGSVAVAAKHAGVARPEPVLLGLAASAICLAMGAARRGAQEHSLSGSVWWR